MWEALHYEFLRNAIFCGILVGIICAVVGTLVVVNRVVFLCGGIAHAAYGGIGIAIYLGISPYIGATIFTLIMAIVMGVVSLKDRERSDTIIGVIWALGMALGILFVDLSAGYQKDLMAYLFGSILSISLNDIFFISVVTALITLTVSIFYKEFLAMSFDEEFCKVIGLPVTSFYLILMVMISLSVVILIKMVGLILVIALLSIPPYISEKFTTSISKMMILSAILSIIFILVGLWISYRFDISASATIILVAGTGFLLTLILERWHLQFKW